MSDKAFWSVVIEIGGLLLIGFSAGPLAALGVFLCIGSHLMDKHLSNASLTGDGTASRAHCVGQDVDR